MLISSDTWPGTGGVLGLTKAQTAGRAPRRQTERRRRHAYLQRPDGVIVEFLGNQPQGA